MGNCIALQAKVIRVMKTDDGKILEYKAPMKVYQVLSQFKTHAISDSLPVVQYLHADADMHGGCLYYLLPEPAKNKVKFADQVEEEEEEEEMGEQVRIKLVISKQELKSMVMMSEEEGISLTDIFCHLQNEGSSCNEEVISKGWKPMLDSIPEID